jgi:hypothetical protein
MAENINIYEGTSRFRGLFRPRCSKLKRIAESKWVQMSYPRQTVAGPKFCKAYGCKAYGLTRWHSQLGGFTSDLQLIEEEVVGPFNTWVKLWQRIR